MMKHRNLTPFQQALLDAVLNEDRDALEEKEPVAFSEDFMRRMNKLVKQTKGTLSFKTKRVLRNILIAAIIVSLLAGTVMAIPAIREAIIDFFLQVKDDRVGITFNPEEAATAPNEIKTTYTITDIPEEYEEVVRDVFPDEACIWWVNSDDQWITYTQYLIPENATAEKWFMLEIPMDNKEQLVIADYLVEIVRSEGFYHLVWTNNEYVFVLELPDTINDETMQKIFKSWQPEKSG